VGQQWHDDLAEEPHRVLADGVADAIADEALELVLGEDGVEEDQGAGATAHAALWAARRRGTARQPPSGGVALGRR
jgi:hypothetical protein